MYDYFRLMMSHLQLTEETVFFVPLVANNFPSNGVSSVVFFCLFHSNRKRERERKFPKVCHQSFSVQIFGLKGFKWSTGVWWREMILIQEKGSGEVEWWWWLEEDVLEQVWRYKMKSPAWVGRCAQSSCFPALTINVRVCVLFIFKRKVEEIE